MSRKILTTLVLTGFLNFSGCSHNKNRPEIKYINLLGGYTTTREAFPILKTLAGLHAGTTKFYFQRHGNDINPFTIGGYDMKKYPISMEFVAEKADADTNMVINLKEAIDLRDSFYNMLLEPYLKK